MQRQVPEIPAENYLIEPAPRGTASVVGLAAAVLQKRDPRGRNGDSAFRSFHSQSRSVPLFAPRGASKWPEQDYLVTLGITPTFPSTAYGYIQQGEPLSR